MHPLLLDHIVPDPSLHTLPTISLMDTSLSYFKLHNLLYLAVDVLTDDMTIPLQTTLNYHIFDLCNNTHITPDKHQSTPVALKINPASQLTHHLIP